MVVLATMQSHESASGTVHASAQQRRALAERSVATNLRDPDFVARFEVYFEELGISGDGSTLLTPHRRRKRVRTAAVALVVVVVVGMMVCVFSLHACMSGG